MASGLVLITASWLKMLFKHSSVLQISLKKFYEWKFSMQYRDILFRKVSLIIQLAKIKC